MKAIAITSYGGRERLGFMDLPTPAPAAGEVLIRIRASGVNPVDWKIREGMLANRMPNIFPLIIGLECAGDVVQCGEGVTRVAEGDRVFAYARKETLHDGTYAEFIALPQSSVTRLPRALSYEEGASIPLAALTAWQALFEMGGLKAGQTVLVHAGAGGTGGFAVQLARHAGARIIATASAPNHDYVRGLGAHEAIDYTRVDFRDAVRDAAPQGVDLVYDTVGGDVQVRSADVVKPGGMLVSILAFADEAALQQKGIQTRYLFVRPVAEHLDALARLIEAGHLRTHLARVLPWTEAAAAHELIEGGHTRGKIVLRIS